MVLSGIIAGTAVVAGTGLLIGVFLGVAGKAFAVATDPREDAVNAALPGNNCGGCGYAGCAGLAAAIVAGEAEAGACPVGGTAVAEEIARIMGLEETEITPMTAFVKCVGTGEVAGQDYIYTGVEDCEMVGYIPGGGAKTCNYGCLGYGNCVRACPFDAIHIVDGIARGDKAACKACKKCVVACPRQLIELVPREMTHMVCCRSEDKGKDVMKACQKGCIGCKMCVKVCQYDAITVTSNVAHIDPEKCTGCGACVEKCPKHCIC